MVKIGDYNLVYNYNLIIPAGESATVDASFDYWRLTVSVKFESDTEEKLNKAEIDIRGNGQDHATLVFRNWISPLGTAMNEPGYLGTSKVNKTELYFIAAHWLIGQTNRLDLQLMTRAKQ